MADDEWTSTCKEWLTDTEYVYGGGILSVEDGNLYACHPADVIYQSEYQKEIETEDGSKDTITVNEPSEFARLFKTKYGSVHLATEKYTFVKCEEVEGVTVFSFAKPSGGMYVVSTGNGYAVLGCFDKSKGQDDSNSRSCVIAFAKYLQENGY